MEINGKSYEIYIFASFAKWHFVVRPWIENMKSYVYIMFNKANTSDVHGTRTKKYYVIYFFGKKYSIYFVLGVFFVWAAILGNTLAFPFPINVKPNFIEWQINYIGFPQACSWCGKSSTFIYNRKSSGSHFLKAFEKLGISLSVHLSLLVISLWIFQKKICLKVLNSANNREGSIHFQKNSLFYNIVRGRNFPLNIL